MLRCGKKQVAVCGVFFFCLLYAMLRCGNRNELYVVSFCLLLSVACNITLSKKQVAVCGVFFVCILPFVCYVTFWEKQLAVCGVFLFVFLCRMQCYVVGKASSCMWCIFVRFCLLYAMLHCEKNKQLYVVYFFSLWCM